MKSAVENSCRCFPLTPGTHSSDLQGLPLQVWDINAWFIFRRHCLHYVTPQVQNQQWLFSEHHIKASGDGPRPSKLCSLPLLFRKKSPCQPRWFPHLELAHTMLHPVHWLLLFWPGISSLIPPDCPQLSTVPCQDMCSYIPFWYWPHRSTASVWI